MVCRFGISGTFGFLIAYRIKINNGKKAIISVSRKQKLNMKISTEVELVGMDDASSLVLWTNHFLEAQLHKAK